MTPETVKGNSSAAPRLGFSYKVGAKHRCACGEDMAQRLEECQFLYKQKPTSTWWGWEFLQIDGVRAMQK